MTSKRSSAGSSTCSGRGANPRTRIQVNLKSDAGREALLRLVASADVLVESFRPGGVAST